MCVADCLRPGPPGRDAQLAHGRIVSPPDVRFSEGVAGRCQLREETTKVAHPRDRRRGLGRSARVSSRVSRGIPATQIVHIRAAVVDVEIIA